MGELDGRKKPNHTLKILDCILRAKDTGVLILDLHF